MRKSDRTSQQVVIKLKSKIWLKLGTNVGFGEGVIKAEIVSQNLLFPFEVPPLAKKAI